MANIPAVPDMVVPRKTVATRPIPRNSINSSTRPKAQVPHTTGTPLLRDNMEMHLGPAVRKARRVLAQHLSVAPQVVSLATNWEVDSWEAQLERPSVPLV